MSIQSTSNLSMFRPYRQETVTNPNKDRSLPGKARRMARRDARRAAVHPSTRPLPPENLSALTVAELRERAREMGLSGYSGLKKADLVNLVEQTRHPAFK